MWIYESVKKALQAQRKQNKVIQKIFAFRKKEKTIVFLHECQSISAYLTMIA